MKTQVGKTLKGGREKTMQWWKKQLYLKR